ncbi:MAG: AbrB/MazE/SpoVT family DNA-binding domain-containing protein [Candidatus Aenigmarchaeota archaeon]|nr:AbrB/MazE/SpoVT family DNA-binding domain-containing protein [Candidatus Aenigmarchaeota archaeon]
MSEVTKVTSKGQVVIPQEIRNDLGIEEGSRLVVSRLGDLVLMKKIAIPDPKKEFNELTKFGTKFAKQKGIRSEKDVVSRIHKSRGVKNDQDRT